MSIFNLQRIDRFNIVYSSLSNLMFRLFRNCRSSWLISASRCSIEISLNLGRSSSSLATGFSLNAMVASRMSITSAPDARIRSIASWISSDSLIASLIASPSWRINLSRFSSKTLPRYVALTARGFDHDLGHMLKTSEPDDFSNLLLRPKRRSKPGTARRRANLRRHDLELHVNLNTNRFGILFAYVNNQSQRAKREIRHFIGRRAERPFHAGGRRARH